MKARRTAPYGILLVTALLATIAVECQAQYRTPNFVVYAPQPAFAKQVGDEAERFRKELAELWLGKELPQWPQPCPITVEIGPHAGGETSFAFAPNRSGVSQPFDWRMKIYGPPERLLDSVLPHEVTHTIFATHYGRPLPRWADEGACTTVEHEVERKKNHKMLIEFLTTRRGIPFNHMFAMKQYPQDILPLYAQGYSLARYLIMQRGHRHFVNYVGEGMQREIPGREPQTWNQVSQKYYGYKDLSDLQLQWQSWVRDGCPAIARKTGPVQGNAVAHTSPPVARSGQPVAMVSVTPRKSTPQGNALTLSNQESWYVKQSRLGGNSTLQRPASASSQGYLPGSIRESTRNATGQPGSSEKTLWR